MAEIKVSTTMCIVRTSGFARGVCKIRKFILNLKGFLVEFPENRRPENQKPSRKSPEKWTFLSLAFYNAHLVWTSLK